jgi:hypothetical protein
MSQLCQNLNVSRYIQIYLKFKHHFIDLGSALVLRRFCSRKPLNLFYLTGTKELGWKVVVWCRSSIIQVSEKERISSIWWYYSRYWHLISEQFNNFVNQMMIVIPIQSVTLFRFRNSQSSEDMGHMAH